MVLANSRFQIDVTEQRPQPLVPAPHPSASAKAQDERITSRIPLTRDFFNGLLGRTRVFLRLWKINLSLSGAFTQARLGAALKHPLWLTEQWEVEARRPRIEAKGQL